MTGAPLLVLHDLGDPQGGARWQALLDAWPAGGLAPDLPGHGEAGPPPGGIYGPGDPALWALRWLRERDWADAGPVVVAHGRSGYGAELLAAAGRVTRLVLVDGLGGPWRDAAGVLADQHRWLRDVLADPAALAVPSVVPDPLLAHGLASVWEREFTDRRRASIAVPVMAVESPESPTAVAERAERLAAFGGPTRLVTVPEVSPPLLAEIVAASQTAES